MYSFILRKEFKLVTATGEQIFTSLPDFLKSWNACDEANKQAFVKSSNSEVWNIFNFKFSQV